MVSGTDGGGGGGVPPTLCFATPTFCHIEWFPVQKIVVFYLRHAKLPQL